MAYEKFFAAIGMAIERRDGRKIPVDALVLLLKGGVSLRMNLLEMVRNLSSTAEGDIALFLRDELKMSDFDFEITSNPTFITPEDVSRINILSYIVLQHIRTYLVEHSDSFFTFFRYSKEYQRKLLDTLRTTIQSKIQQQPPSSPYSGVQVEALAISPLSKSSTIFSSRLPGFDPSLYNSTVPTMDSTHPAGRADFAIIPSASQTALQKKSDPLICFVASRDLLCAYGIRTGRHPRHARTRTRRPG